MMLKTVGTVFFSFRFFVGKIFVEKFLVEKFFEKFRRKNDFDRKNIF